MSDEVSGLQQLIREKQTLALYTGFTMPKSVSHKLIAFSKLLL